MSSRALPSATGDPRPLWHAGFASLVAQASAALVPAMFIRDALLAHLNEGSFKETGWTYRLPEALTPAWFAEAAIAYGWAFLCVLPGTLLLLAIVKRMERDEAGTALEWGVAGAAAAIPLALGLCILVGTTTHGPTPFFVYPIISVVPCAIGLCGGIVARRFRHRPDWSDPL